MNLYDISQEGLELKAKMQNISSVVNQLKEINNNIIKNNINNSIFLLIKAINGSDPVNIQNASEIKSNNRQCYDTFIRELRKVDFMESIMDIAYISGKYSYFNVETFVEIFTSTYKSIHQFISELNTEKQREIYKELVLKINDMINAYYSVLDNIQSIIKVNKTLSYASDNETLRIRFMSEDNSIDMVIKNITVFRDIYIKICEIIGQEDRNLQYGRIESGSLEMLLCGAGTAITIVSPIVKFAYKVYSEQFSPKAKLEKQELEEKIKQLKINNRSSYIKLIKDINPNIDLSNDIQTKLMDLDNNLEDLFMNNPCIRVDNEEIGIREMANTQIPVQRLPSVNETIEEGPTQTE